MLYIEHHLIDSKRVELSGAYVIKEWTICIADWAFYGCEGLTEISIPPSIKSIGHEAFKGCNALSDEEGFIIVNHTLYGYCGSDSELTIPDGVELIGEGAFRFSRELTGITIPKSVVSIGDYAFEDCEKLNNVSVLRNVKSIGKKAFYKCRSMNSIEFQKGLVTIKDGAFDRSGLRTIVLPRRVAHIGEYAIPPYTKKAYSKSVTVE